MRGYGVQIAGKCALWMVLLGLALSGAGCLSLQIPKGENSVRLIGVGRCQELPCEKGRAVRISAPGLSLRLHKFNPGISLGYHELLLLYADETSHQGEKTNPPAAFQRQAAGLDAGPMYLSLGVHREFIIPAPPEAISLKQEVRYSDRETGDIYIRREETHEK